MYETNQDTASLRISADYFRRTGDLRRLMRANFQFAEICDLSGDIEAGFIPALEGLDIASKLGETEYIGRLNETISDFYIRRWNRRSALDHILRATEAFKAAGLEPNYRYAKIEEAAAYINLFNFEGARRILDSIIPQIPPEDSAVMSVAYNHRMVAEYYMGQLPEARKSFGEAMRYTTAKFEPEASFEARLAIMEGKLEEALRILDEWGANLADGGEGDMRYRYAQYLYKKEAGDSAGALRDYEEYRRIVADESIENLNNRLSRLLADYRAKQKAEATDRSLLDRKRLLWGCIIAAAILSTLVVWYRAALRRRRKLLERKMAVIAEMSDAMKSRDSQMRSLFHEQFRRINELSLRYLKLPAGTPAGERENILAMAKEALKELGRREKMEALVEEFDIVHDGLASHIRRSLPRLKARDFHILVLSLSGLQPKVVSVVFDIRPETCYTVRTRLRQRMLESDDERLREAASELN
ncbi:MAG: hypothetical protein K2M06_05335 [Muribaculaceae bacterium]|nr:hypothetical protein [Muribaculaceae bacterium]